ncbi:unnamed protein product [Angiostrongylus costaricensis]|uniref:Transmembrane 9 superfamily member n=1 Tax=Angiostrongylus costaricensis TaxID=334426 RepID=A0A0R3PHM7_ANGCS|nr:unnamed protein product [Angiostrongylus costaricensis]
MPLCAPEHLQLVECGTVISCDWAEADRDKVRPMANSSDFSCCYRAVVKEKGDCVEQLVTESEPVQMNKALYIVMLRISAPKHWKVSQSDEKNCHQALVMHPLVDMRHFDNTVCSGHLRADELSTVRVPMLNILGAFILIQYVRSFVYQVSIGSTLPFAGYFVSSLGPLAVGGSLNNKPVLAQQLHTT